jgi:hypothetical protein
MRTGVAAIVMAALVLVSCSTAGTGTSTPTVPTAATSPPATLPSRTLPPDPPIEEPVTTLPPVGDPPPQLAPVESFLEWSTVVVADSQTFGMFEVGFGPGSLVLGEERIVIRDGEVTLLPAEGDSGWIHQRVVVDGNVALLKWTNEPGPGYRLDRVDLEASAVDTWVEVGAEDGDPPWRYPDLTAAGDVFIAETNGTGETCLRPLDPGGSLGDPILCNPDPGAEVFIVDVDDDVVSYVSQVADPADGPACRRLLERRDDTTPIVHGVRECGLFMAAVDGDALAWTEQPSGGFYDRAPVYGEGPDAVVTGLGVGSANSLVMCDRRAYWKAPGPDGTSEIRSWTPGGSLDIIYRSIPGQSTGLPQCSGPYVMLVVWNHDEPSAPRQLLMAGPAQGIPDVVTLP